MSQQQPQPNNENQLVALERTLQILREDDNPDVLIETTLDYLSTEFNYRLVWIGLYDRLDHQLFGQGGMMPTGSTAFLKQRFTLNPGDLLEQVVIQQRSLAIPDLRQEPRAGEWRRVAHEQGIQGTLLFPLRCKDRCFGVALLGSHFWGISPRPGEKAQLSLLLGGLAAALYQIEVEWQRSTTKRADQPLFQVLNDLVQSTTLAARLEAMVKITQQFVAPTRTNLYWYSPERRYFWCRVGNRQHIPRLGERNSAAGLTVAEASDFYQALVAGQMVAIGAGRSLLKAETTERLITRLRTRSLLAAPIQANGELLGFLAVEDKEPRIWEEAERNYVGAMAQLASLLAGTEDMEAKLVQTQQDSALLAEMAQLIAGSSDTLTALKNCASLLCQHLEAERFIVLQADESGQFTLVVQQQPLNRRSLTIPLAALEFHERQWLLQETQASMIEDWDTTLRLLQWRKPLTAIGVRSALLVPLKLDNTQAQAGNVERLSLLIIAQATPRTWSGQERELVGLVAQQLNVMLTLEQLQERAKASFLTYQTLQAGLANLAQAPLDPIAFERTWLQYLATLLECPLTALISWTPESEYAHVSAAVVADPRFALPPELDIPIAHNTLIQDAVATPHFLSRPVASFGASTRKWLSSPGIGQLLIIALDTQDVSTTGIVVFADHEERQWPMHLFTPLETLMTQFAWLRHYRHAVSRHTQDGETLQRLHWYKHRCLETFYQSVRESLKALLKLETKTQKVSPDAEAASHQPLQHTRRQQVLHQLEQTLAVFSPVFQEEQWQWSVNRRPVPLASLFRRSLRHVEPLYTQRQLLLKVHNLGKYSVYADRLQLECVLFELLVTACFHAQPGSWIHVWCCCVGTESKAQNGKAGEPDNLTPSSTPCLELLMAESGLLEECLNAKSSEPLAQLPNQNLKICQTVLHSWGGDLQFYPLQGSRDCIRLLLPLVNSIEE